MTSKVSTDSDYETICQKLDELSLELLVTMKDYINLKVMIEDCLKSGTIHLAKARYIMGNKCVSALQLPTEDSEVLANTKVNKTENASDDLSFEVNRLSLNDTNTKSSTRRINTDKDANDQGEAESPEKSKPRTVSKDPLKWFGVLVPQDLRSAQVKFSTGVDKVVECANMQLYLRKIQKEYQELLLLKDNFDTTKTA